MKTTTKTSEIDSLFTALAKARRRGDAWMTGYCEERIRVLQAK